MQQARAGAIQECCDCPAVVFRQVVCIHSLQHHSRGRCSCSTVGVLCSWARVTQQDLSSGSLHKLPTLCCCGAMAPAIMSTTCALLASAMLAPVPAGSACWAWGCPLGVSTPRCAKSRPLTAIQHAAWLGGCPNRTGLLIIGAAASSVSPDTKGCSLIVLQVHDKLRVYLLVGADRVAELGWTAGTDSWDRPTQTQL